MKKIIALFLSVLMLSACTDKNTSSGTDTKANNPTIADESKPDDSPLIPRPDVPANQEMRDITAFDMSKEFVVGWNLGNSLDALGKGLSGETAWGNARITRELIDGVKAAGFNVIRIPITWVYYIGEAPEYKIDEDRMNRVQEVVNYAIEAGLYTIINVHHDGNDTEETWLTPAPKNKEEMFAKYTKVWEQISERFKDYGDHLIFESMNELHKGYGTPEESWLTITNELNQTFIDVVRKSGGNNDKRIVVLPGYNTNIEHTLNHFVMPKDTVENKVIVSVHYYDPYLTTLQAKVKKWGKFAEGKTEKWGQEDHAEKSFDSLKEKFIDNNIPVIIGECGATAGVERAYRIYYDEYIVKTAKDRQITAILWDNGSPKTTGAEAFGIMNRATRAPRDELLVQAIMEAASGKDYEVVLRVEPEPAATKETDAS